MKKLLLALALLVPLAAQAQSTFPTAGGGGARVPGAVDMCLDASSQAVACFSDTGGATPSKVISTASTNSNLIKGSPGTLYDVFAINTNAATAFLKFYNKATAPTCPTDTVVATVALIQNIPVSMPTLIGKRFTLGIGLCITGAIADNDNTNATTGIVVSFGSK